MNIIKPEQLKTASELLDAEVNFALTSHPYDDGFCKVDVSHTTSKFTPEQALQLMTALCERVEETGYFCYFSTYMTMAARHYIMISPRPFKRVYYIHDIGVITEHTFKYYLPFPGVFEKKDAEAQMRWWKEYRGHFDKLIEPKPKSFWDKFFNS